MKLNEMQYGVDFAYSNRKLMKHNAVSVFKDCFRGNFSGVEFIHIAYN
jgi:RNA-splicing ligase RtcB